MKMNRKFPRRYLTFFFYLWFLTNLPLAFPERSDRCLINKPEVGTKKYSQIDGQHTDIVVETSSRPLHKLSSEIFKIFLEEVLGYSKVRIVDQQIDFESESIVVDRLTPPPDDEKIVLPQSMINLEVWIPPEFDLKNLEDTQLILEFGRVAPPGRFGWFIPLEMDQQVKRYYKKWQDDVREVHWTFLRDMKIMQNFDVTGSQLDFVKTNLKSYSSTNSSYYCSAKVCTNGMYIPDWCNSYPCGVLLTSHYESTKFVIDHINELKLYVKVAWLGDKLKQTVDTLNQQYNSTRSSKSLMMLHYTPSDLILRETNFISVVFKHCDPLKSNTSIGCKYELNRLVKLSWNKIGKLGLAPALRKFKFNEEDYNDLLTLYERLRDNSTLRQIGCQWMLEKERTWSDIWGADSDSTTIYIGGIFPISESSYNGAGILRGAILAQNAINNNSVILPNNQIRLKVSNGRCSADSVMKAFIDYIVDGYYDNLIGVLGPACSDTVEPLAGVSKHYHIMVISYSAEGASFSDREKYPYFFRTIGENKHYKHVYLQLFKKLGWTRVAALTEDGQKYTEYISHMQEILEENKITFISNTKFPRERETFQMTRYLEDLKRKSARIIILDVIDEIARTVMCEAFHLKMTSTEGYVWFLPTWLNDTWYDTDYFNARDTEGSHIPKESVNCSTGEMIRAVTGYFSMSHAYFAPEDSNIIGNMTVREWKQKYQDLSYIRGTSDYAGYAYDAVWTYALALDKLIKADPELASFLHSKNTTDKLVQLIQETDFNGVSGRIKFRGGPSRFSIINIMQWYQNKSHIVGYFTPNLTDNTPEILGGHLELNISSLRWFTPDRKIPQDGTIPPATCAIESFAKGLNVTCELAIIILNIILVSIILVGVAAVMYFMKKRYDKKFSDTKKYMRHFGIDLLLNPTAISDLDKWEIARNSVVINRKLGEGAFGTVYGGEADLPEKGWVAVAVKTLKVGSSSEEKLDFLSEAEVMKRFEHKNIVKLLGVCTKDEPIYTIMEFMLYGDLKTFLLARRHLVNKRNFEESEEISSKKLTSMALDVARGLSYLAELKYVHRDVASRNCLINVHKVVKLGDFGMTRPMFENDYYKFTRKGMLPVRWMSPESLALGVFTPASDVWSYGVLLYEIITFGSFPYQGMNNMQVLDFVKNGNTITIPQGVKPQLHGLLKSCWQQDSKERTRASEIVEFLANNPRLIAPCLDVPLPSIQLDDNDQVEFNLPDQFRKCSTLSAKSSSHIALNGISSHSFDKIDDSIRQDTSNGTNGTPLVENCPKEPLLGTAKSSSSLLSFGKYVAIQHHNDKSVVDNDDDDDYLQHSASNGYVISKV